MKYSQTILKIAVHSDHDNPCFGETSTHISLEDEAGGFFIELSQCHDNIEPGKVRFDPTEWQAINTAVKTLLSNAPRQD